MEGFSDNNFEMKIKSILKTILILVTFSFPAITAETKTEVIQSIGDLNSWNLRTWIEKKIPVRMENCRFLTRETISTVIYLTLRCPDGEKNNFIHFGKKGSYPASDTIRIVGIHTIGKRKYTEIEYLESANPPSHLERFQTRPKDLTNLTIFLELLRIPTEQRKEYEGMEVFFHKDCPLRYLGFNHDFDWDNSAFHEFEITCINTSEGPMIVSFHGDSLGRIPLDNKMVTELTPGKFFLARVFLERWNKDSIVWKDALIYSYEK